MLYFSKLMKSFHINFMADTPSVYTTGRKSAVICRKFGHTTLSHGLFLEWLLQWFAADIIAFERSSAALHIQLLEKLKLSRIARPIHYISIRPFVHDALSAYSQHDEEYLDD